MDSKTEKNFDPLGIAVYYRNMRAVATAADLKTENAALRVRIAELEAIVEQRNKMCSDYYKRIAELEAALKEAENRAALHSSDAALLNANNDRIFKICRKALELGDEH